MKSFREFEVGDIVEYINISRITSDKEFYKGLGIIIGREKIYIPESLAQDEKEMEFFIIKTTKLKEVRITKGFLKKIKK